MKRVLSLVLVMALILSCLVTGSMFSANALLTKYLNVTDVKGMTNAYTDKWYTNGGTVTNGALDTVKTQFVQDKVNYIDYGSETVTANYDGAYVITSKAEEAFINNTGAPESFRYRPGTALTVTNTDYVMMYVEVPNYANLESNKDWGLGFYGMTFNNAAGATGWLNITSELTECLSYMALGQSSWTNAKILPSGNGVRVCKTNIPSGFKGYIRINLAKLPMKYSGGEFTDPTKLAEIDVAYNGVSQTDPLVLGGLIYALSADSNGSTLKIGTKTYAISRREVLDGKQVLAISGNALADKWAHCVDGANSGVTYGASYTKSTTIHQEPGEEYISAYPNGTGAAYTYAGSYVFAAKGEKFVNSLTAPETFMYQPKMSVTNANSVLVYVEVPDYAALGETWGFGLEKFILSDGTFYASFNNKEELTTGLQYVDANGNWTNATIYARGEGEKINKTNIPSGYKGYICFDLPNLDTVGSDNKGNLYTNKKTNYVSLYAYSVAYNGLSTGDNFVSGGLFYATTSVNSTVLNFGYDSYADLSGKGSDYIKVKGLSTQNWQVTNKQGINATGYAASNEALKTSFTTNKNYAVEPGAAYVNKYKNEGLTPNYSGYRIFTPKTAGTTFKNDAANVENYAWQAKLDITSNDSFMFYVEVPDYKAAGENWGFGFYDIFFKNGAYWSVTGVLNATADVTDAFSYLSIYGTEWENGTIYAKAEGENVIKTNLPSGFKGYVRFDLSKLPVIQSHNSNAWTAYTMLYQLYVAYNAVGTDDPFVLGDIIYRTDNANSTMVNFNGAGYERLTKDLPEVINVLGMAGYEYYMDRTGLERVRKISDANVLGTKEGITTSFTINTNRKEIGQSYTALYNLGTDINDPTNSDLTSKCYGVYEVKSTSGTYTSDTAAPEIFNYQPKLMTTADNAAIIYVELPDYEANGKDWGFGIAKRIDTSKPWVSEFRATGYDYGFYFNRSVTNTTGFSYLAVGDDEWVNGTVYAEETGSKVMKTDLPSGFKGYVRFDLSEFNYMAANGKDATSIVLQNMSKLYELNFAYNGVTETDILTLGGLMYITTDNDGKVLKFKNSAYAPIVSNTMIVRAQNLITDTANETNVTGTNIKIGKFQTDGTLRETNDIENKSFIAEMDLTKSGGLFLDDGYAGAFKPSTKQGTNVLVGSNTNWFNYVVDENLGLKLKAGVNKLMFYVELPDVRDLNFVSDASKALALRAFKIDGYDIKPYGLTYQFMDIREGVWQDGTISDGTEDSGYSTGALLGLPTDGFKGYIKIDLDSLLSNKSKDYVIDKIQIGINRSAWGRKLVIGGFYAVDFDNTDSTAYFMDPKTGEMATTNVVPGDFSCNEEYDAADLALAIKYLIKADSITGAQTARASAFDNYKADFSVVSLVQLKKILSGASLDFTLAIDEDLEASTWEADAAITAQNPDRGFRMKSFTSVDEDYCPTWNLTQWWEKFNTAADATTMSTLGRSVWVEPTINKIYFPLANYYDRDITDEDVLYTNMQRAFDITRKQCKTTIIRFWYDENYDKITNDQMLAHIAQIKANGILERNKDVIHAVEAGFLGIYGEWHKYYDDFWSDANKKPDGTLDVDKIWDREGYNEEAIIAAVLDMVPTEIPVLLREASYRDKFLASSYAKEGDDKRLGLHFDSFYGIYEEGDKVRTTVSPDSASAASAITPMSGEFYWGAEFANEGYERVSAEKAILGFKKYHQNTFSVFHNSWEGTDTVAKIGEDANGNPIYVYGQTDREGDMAQWAVTPISEQWLKDNNVFYAPTWFKDKDGNTVERTQFEFVRDYLGYRLEAKHVKIEGKRARGAEVKVSLDIVNYGFSAPFQMTSELVILDSNNKIVSRVPAGNALDWVNTDTELVTHKINATITLPNAYGKYKIALYVHNRAGTGAYLGNNIEQVDGFNILASFGI